MKYYVIDTKDRNKVLGTFDAKSTKEARIYAATKYNDYVVYGGIAVANEKNYNTYYKNKED